MDAEHHEALRCVAEGRAWDAKDVLLSDLLEAGLIKRTDDFDRKLTAKGEQELNKLPVPKTG